MLIQFLQKNNPFRKIMYNIGRARARHMISKIPPCLKDGDEILDIGAGPCNICEVFMSEGYDITPLDVQDLSFVNGLRPVIYDGAKIPFADNRFDKALILTVLHHTPDPEMVIREAKRVSKEIIIMEDIFDNWLHKYLTYFIDSVLNLEFVGHPHTNRSDQGWQETFERLGLELVHVRYDHALSFVLKNATYYLRT